MIRQRFITLPGNTTAAILWTPPSDWDHDRPERWFGCEFERGIEHYYARILGLELSLVGPWGLP